MRLQSAEFRRFSKLKDRYLRRVAWYVDHAHDDSYVTYAPTYIYDMDQCGPYIPSCQMKLADEKRCFEGVLCAIPAHYDEVLKTYYGAWRTVPFRTIEQMRKAAKGKGPDMWFSEFVRAVTPLKHMRNVQLANPVESKA